MSVENGKDDEDTSEDINQDDGERKSEGKFAFSGLQRLARQLDDDYPLLANEVFKVFIQSCNVQVAAITREGFQRRFERFLQKVAQSIETPAPEVLDGLFHQAIQAKRQIATWKNIAKAIKSDKFGRSLKFLRVEIKRFETIRKAFQNARKIPPWMSSWERLWVEPFEELQQLIEAQLRAATLYLETLSKLATLGRTDVESLVLLESRHRIRGIVAQTPLSKAPSVILSSFAYAAELVPSKDHADDAEGMYVDAIKSRIKRAKRSKALASVLITVRMANFEEVSSDRK